MTIFRYDKLLQPGAIQFYIMNNLWYVHPKCYQPRLMTWILSIEIDLGSILKANEIDATSRYVFVG